MSKTKKIPLNEATLEELRFYCQAVLGVPVSHNPKTGADVFIAKIKAVKGQDFNTIEVPDETPEEQGAAPEGVPPQPVKKNVRALSAGSSKNDPKVTLTIPEQDIPGGKRAVPIGVNGSFFLIPRGIKCEIPYRYYLALQNAVQTTYTQDKDTNEFTESTVPSYPHLVLQMPPQEEIDAWMAEQEAISEDQAA